MNAFLDLEIHTQLHIKRVTKIINFIIFWRKLTVHEIMYIDRYSKKYIENKYVSK